MVSLCLISTCTLVDVFRVKSVVQKYGIYNALCLILVVNILTEWNHVSISMIKNKIDKIDELKAELYRRSCYIFVIPINGILTALLALSIWLREDLELVQYCLYGASIRLHNLVAMIGPNFDGLYCRVVLALLDMNCDTAYNYDNRKGNILNLCFIVISTDLRQTKYLTRRYDRSYSILIC